MAILNTKSLSTDTLETNYFPNIGYTLDGKSEIDYKNGIIYLEPAFEDRTRLKRDFGYNLYELDLDKWEEYGYSKEIVFESSNDKPCNIRLKGKNIQNYTFKGRKIGIILDNTQIFKNNNLANISILQIFLFNKKYENCGKPIFGYNFVEKYGYRGTSLEDIKDKLLDGNFYPNKFFLYLGKSRSKIPKYDYYDVYGLFNKKAEVWLY
nr:MAG TPA: hypothetical protein [Caudoviricetes sp.]